MKRYFIFGFLTILIITLNFAFIIILIKEDMEINFGFLFVLWATVIGAAAGLAYIENTRKKKKIAASELKQKPPPEDHLKPTEEEVSPTLLYKQKTLQKFRINLSKDFNEKLTSGFFGGYIVTEEFAGEEVQAVYSDKEQLLGFISKKEKQLCQNLKQLYKKPILCWGNLVWNEEEEQYVVKGLVPILYTEPEMNRFRNLVSLKAELLEMERAKKEIVPGTYFEKAENLIFFEQTEPIPPSLHHPIDPELLAEYCRNHKISENWKKILQLEDYPVLLNQLKEPFRGEIFSTITMARSKLQDLP